MELNTARKAENEIQAKKLGISPQKVDKARKVMEYGSPDIQEQVQSGEKSISKAFNEIQEHRREITDRKNIEELQIQNWHLKKQESLSRMAAAIAHHFNNYLMGIMGNLELSLK
jgi:signal transduction histidine kinase